MIIIPFCDILCHLLSLYPSDSWGNSIPLADLGRSEGLGLKVCHGRLYFAGGIPRRGRVASHWHSPRKVNGKWVYLHSADVLAAAHLSLANQVLHSEAPPHHTQHNPGLRRSEGVQGGARRFRTYHEAH